MIFLQNEENKSLLSITFNYKLKLQNITQNEKKHCHYNGWIF